MRYVDDLSRVNLPLAYCQLGLEKHEHLFEVDFMATLMNVSQILVLLYSSVLVSTCTWGEYLSLFLLSAPVWSQDIRKLVFLNFMGRLCNGFIGAFLPPAVAKNVPVRTVRVNQNCRFVARKPKWRYSWGQLRSQATDPLSHTHSFVLHCFIRNYNTVSTKLFFFFCWPNHAVLYCYHQYT